MSETPTVIEITTEWLTEHGYGGLVNDEGCGCFLEDFYPCGEAADECQAAWRVSCLHRDCPRYDICEGDRDNAEWCLTTEPPAGRRA